MAVKKISISLESDLADALELAAQRSGRSRSELTAVALRRELKIQEGLAAVAEWESENGSISAEELAFARQKLGIL